MSVALIECADVSKTFGTVPALRGVSLVVSAGEMVAITGPSGSGKSTLLHCLAGVQVPDAGRVAFEGNRIDDLTPDQRTILRRRSFGFVPQFGQIVPELTAEQNVALPLLLDRVGRAEAFQRARVWLAHVDLADLANRTPAEMSGGERQRVAVARALVHEPSVVFADEPTGTLDSLSAERLLELLTRLVSSASVALVIVTHDPRVAAYAAREVVIRDGLATAV